MLITTVVLYLILQFIQFGHCNDLSPSQSYGVHIESSPEYWIIEQNRIEFSDFIDVLFPIEINVPDTVMSAWEGIGSAWTAASDYFSNQETL